MQPAATYVPNPIDTSEVQWLSELEDLKEELARNTHDVWARQKIADGWSYGAVIDARAKTHTDLVPYEQLPAATKTYDVNTAVETLKMILALGYTILPPTAKQPKRR